MQVTSAIITLAPTPGKKFKGWAKVLFDGKLMVTGIRLFEDTTRTDGKNPRYIRFPDRQPSLNSTGGEFVSIAVVNTNDEELRAHITDAVFAEYDKLPKVKKAKELAASQIQNAPGTPE